MPSELNIKDSNYVRAVDSAVKDHVAETRDAERLADELKNPGAFSAVATLVHKFYPPGGHLRLQPNDTIKRCRLDLDKFLKHVDSNLFTSVIWAGKGHLSHGEATSLVTELAALNAKGNDESQKFAATVGDSSASVPDRINAIISLAASGASQIALLMKVLGENAYSDTTYPVAQAAVRALELAGSMTSAPFLNRLITRSDLHTDVRDAIAEAMYDGLYDNNSKAALQVAQRDFYPPGSGLFVKVQHAIDDAASKPPSRELLLERANAHAQYDSNWLAAGYVSHSDRFLEPHSFSDWRNIW